MKPTVPAVPALAATPAASPNASGVFISTVASMHSGKVLEDLDDAIREVVRSVQASGSKGKLSLEIVIVPNGVGVGETPLFRLEDKIKVSLPKKPRTPSVFFADEDSNLTRRNPRQDEMKLVTMEGGKPVSAEPAGVAAAAKSS